MCVNSPRNTGEFSFTAARTALVADLIRRVLEDMHAGQVLVAEVGELPSRLAGALMIRPIMGSFDSLDAAMTALGGVFGLVVTADEHDVGGPHVLVGAVGVDDGQPQSLDALIRSGRDPLALRVVLLAVAHDQPLTLTNECLDRAEELLGHWRRCVAEWGRHASAPMPGAAVARADRALDDNLDVGAVLDTLHQLEDDVAIPAGAKFETFVHVDRVLAFDLVRDLGRSAPISP